MYYSAEVRTRLKHSITLPNIMPPLQAGKEANLWTYCLKGGYQSIMHQRVGLGQIYSYVVVV